MNQDFYLGFLISSLRPYHEQILAHPDNLVDFLKNVQSHGMSLYLMLSLCSV